MTQKYWVDFYRKDGGVCGSLVWSEAIEDAQQAVKVERTHLVIVSTENEQEFKIYFQGKWWQLEEDEDDE